MNKSDMIDLIAGKCFNNSLLEKEECELIQKTTVKELLSHGFNLNQIDRIRACCLKSKKMHSIHSNEKEC